jgi:hypothetical protein
MVFLRLFKQMSGYVGFEVVTALAMTEEFYLLGCNAV